MEIIYIYVGRKRLAYSFSLKRNVKYGDNIYIYIWGKEKVSL